MLTKWVFLGLLGFSALVLSGCELLSKYGGSSGATKTQQEELTGGQSQTQNQTGEQVTITFSDSGVIPAQVTVKSGGLIRWVNETSVKIQAASDPHPTHTANPEITNGDFVIEVAPGESASVTVTKAGTWGFHNHLKPGVRGKLVVE